MTKLANQNLADSAAFDKQINAAKVINRENSGAGFFSSISVNKLDTKVKSSIYSGIFAKISGMKNPMAFVLFANDGFIAQLEGASIDEETSHIDFSQVEFEVL